MSFFIVAVSGAKALSVPLLKRDQGTRSKREQTFLLFKTVLRGE